MPRTGFVARRLTSIFGKFVLTPMRAAWRAAGPVLAVVTLVGSRKTSWCSALQLAARCCCDLHSFPADLLLSSSQSANRVPDRRRRVRWCEPPDPYGYQSGRVAMGFIARASRCAQHAHVFCHSLAEFDRSRSLTPSHALHPTRSPCACALINDVCMRMHVHVWLSVYLPACMHGTCVCCATRLHTR